MERWRDDPADVRPMLASLAEPPLHGPGLVYEPKYDGIRALVDVRPGRGRTGPPHIAIYSRNGNEKHEQFPAIVQALGSVARRIDGPVLLDGEIVAVDPTGVPLGFQHLQGRIHLTLAADIARAERAQPTVLVLFDILRDGDQDMRGQPLAARRLRLQQRVRPTRAEAGCLRLSTLVIDDGRPLLEQARREGWEGLIVKDGQSIYQSGRRTPSWRKLKLHKAQELVIGGWTEPRHTRQHFGALLVGYYDDTGKLRWAGSVGTGFNAKELDRVKTLLDRHATDRSPFVDRVRTIERAHWTAPALVAQVRFTEWTSDGLLRHPVYLGLRTDKDPRDVRREEISSPPPAPEPTRQRTAAGVRPATVRRPSTAGRSNPARHSSDSKTEVVLAQDVARLVDRLSALEVERRDGVLELPGGVRVRVTNLSKVFWPALKLTKGDLLRYYARVAPLILPAVDDRPLVMKRFPNGVDRQAFYQQRHPEAAPPGVRRQVLPDDVEPIDEEGPRDRLIGGSLATLLYMTQLAAISQDPWFSRVSDPLHPDYVALDLDPGEETPFARVLDVARWIKETLDRYAIPAVPKTSGSSGLHIYVPLPPGTTYETGQLLCQMVATEVATRHSRVATVERMVRKRPRGTVYVDYLQNILGKTLATAYSARASDYAGVSTPLTWREVAGPVDPRAFTIRTAPDRFADVGDLWRPLREGKRVDIQALVERATAR
jgi:bifunctional non-homologous end joining protein LigD